MKRKIIPRFTTQTDLWEAVHSTCVVEFEKRLGVPWRVEWRGLFEPPKEHLIDERRARKLVAELGRVAGEVVTFAMEQRAGKRVGGGAAKFLSWWAPDALERFASTSTREKQTPMFWSDASRRPLERQTSGRAHLVDLLDAKNIFQLAPHSEPGKNYNGASRFLNAREFAIVSLLAGNRPEQDVLRQIRLGSGVTVDEVVKLETRNMKEVLRRHGRRSWDPLNFPLHRGASR